MIQSVRGAQGGYLLAADPETISVGDILRALEGDLTPVDCAAFTGENKTCSGEKFCVTKTVWKKIDESIRNTVDSITLKELMEESKKIHNKYHEAERQEL